MREFKPSPEDQEKIRNCPFEPTLFQCGLVVCKTLNPSEIEIQECVPKKKPDYSKVWKDPKMWKNAEMWK